jgi:preprotein translocase subunit SecY
MSVFSLGIMPYISAAILIQYVTIVAPPLQRLRSGGERGIRAIRAYSLWLALLFAANQAYGIGSTLDQIPNLVTEPGALFRLSTVLTLTGGTFLAIWLSEQITLRGVGNGLALILFVGLVLGIASNLPTALAPGMAYASRGVFESNLMLALAVFMVGFVGLVVFVELAWRRVPLEYPGRQVGLATTRTANLSFKLNGSGLIPIYLASWLHGLLIWMGAAGGQSSWIGLVAAQFGNGRVGHLILTAIVIVIFALIYVAFVLDPEEAAEKLNAYGGIIPGIAPGEATAAHLDYVVSRATVLGGAYLAAVALIPDILISYAPLPFYFSGIEVLLVVCVVLDIRAQVRGDGLVNTRG